MKLELASENESPLWVPAWCAKQPGHYVDVEDDDDHNDDEDGDDEGEDVDKDDDRWHGEEGAYCFEKTNVDLMTTMTMKNDSDYDDSNCKQMMKLMTTMIRL